jgi:hypothetical protein
MGGYWKSDLRCRCPAALPGGQTDAMWGVSSPAPWANQHPEDTEVLPILFAILHRRRFFLPSALPDDLDHS